MPEWKYPRPQPGRSNSKHFTVGGKVDREHPCPVAGTDGDPAGVVAGGTGTRSECPSSTTILDHLRLLTAYFLRAGCSVIGLADAEQALALPGRRPGLMVGDLRLPGMHGWELTGRLRSRYPRCPIAITSVLDVQDYPVADAALPKPVTKAHIHQLLTATLMRRERGTTNRSW